MPRSEYDQWVDQYIDQCRRSAEYQAWLEWSDSLAYADPEWIDSHIPAGEGR